MTKSTKITIGVGVALAALAAVLWMNKSFWMWMTLHKWPTQTKASGMTMASKDNYDAASLRSLYFSGHPSWFPDTWKAVPQPVPADDDTDDAA